jgi:hypothetical protein
MLAAYREANPQVHYRTEMIRFKPLPAGIETRLPEAAQYLESLALRKYFDFQPRELNILKSKVIGHGR